VLLFLDNEVHEGSRRHLKAL